MTTEIEPIIFVLPISKQSVQLKPDVAAWVESVKYAIAASRGLSGVSFSLDGQNGGRYHR